MTYFFDYATLCIVYPVEESKIAVSSTFLTKFKSLITKRPELTAIAAKVYNALLLKCIQPETPKILWLNQNSFQKKIDLQLHRF